jgi:hypothetical protein
MTLESGAGADLEGTKSLRSGWNGFGLWQRGAVDGSTQDISLPILFKHSASEIAMSPETESPESKHPYSIYDISHQNRSAEMKKGSSSDQEDLDLKSVALANLKNKGKARQITGADLMMEESLSESGSRLSFSPNDLLQGLHLKMSHGKTSSSTKTPRGSLSLSLNPSTSPVAGQSSRYRNSYFDQLSSFQAASNPSTRARGSQPPQSTTSPKSTVGSQSLPSVPRSVSDSNSNTVTIIPHQRPSSRRYLLDDHTELDEPQSEDLDSGEPLPPPPHAYRNQGEGDLRQSTPPNSLSLRQVVRSLSPRISEMGLESNRYSRPNMDHFYAETLSAEQSILEEDQLLTVNAPSRDSLSSVHFARNVSPSVTPLPTPNTGAVPSEGRSSQTC